MNGFINMFSKTSKLVVSYTDIYVAKRKAANAMERTRDGANCLIVAVSKSVQPL